MVLRVGVIIVLLLILQSTPYPEYPSNQTDKTPLSDFDNCIRHIIENSTDAGIGYQVKFNIQKGFGTSAENNVFLNCEDDFRDIRFVSSSGKMLPYWIEEYHEGINAIVWVRIEDNLSETPSDIYVLSGNPSATSNSNGYDVFQVFSEFSMFFDDQTWSSFSSADARVSAHEKWSQEMAWLSHTEVEGIAFDGEFFYISTARTIDNQGNASLYKVNKSGVLQDSVLLETGSLTHAGGIALHDGILWIPLSERTSSPTSPSKILRYGLNLDFIDEWKNSSEQGNAHWGALCIEPNRDLVYVADYGTSNLYIYDIDGSFIHTITNPPDSNIQSLIVIDGYLYGGQSGYGSNDVVVWEILNRAGTEIRRRGILTTPSGFTDNAITWFNGSWWTCNGEPYTLHELNGADLFLQISEYYIKSQSYVYPGSVVEGLVKMSGNQAFNLGFASSWPAGNPQIISHANQGNTSLYDGMTDYDEIAISSDWMRIGVHWKENYSELWLNGTQSISWSSPTIAISPLKAGLQLWGSADAPLYAKWLFVRKWCVFPPQHGLWEESVCPSISTTTTSSTSTNSTQTPPDTGLFAFGVIIAITSIVCVLVLLRRKLRS